MPFLFRTVFEDLGRPYAEYLASGSDIDRAKWSVIHDAIRFDADQERLVRSFVRKMPVLVMSGTWCGDCAKQCPVVARIAALNPLIDVRFVDRDASSELAGELTICGAPRIPQTVMMDEDFNPVSRVGEKTLSQYRQLHARLAGASCGTGLANQADIDTTTREWLEQFEYAQLVLRLSPRLRERHKD